MDPYATKVKPDPALKAKTAEFDRKYKGPNKLPGDTGYKPKRQLRVDWTGYDSDRDVFATR